MSALITPVDASAAAPAASPATSRTQQMLHGPLLPTLLRLATPNVIGLFAMTVVIGYDGYILGKLGADALAGIALVFPLSMLMMQMSGGGIGGAVTAAVARALGAGRGEEAGRLAQQSLFIAGVLAAAFTLVLLGFGRGVYCGHGRARRGARRGAGLFQRAVQRRHRHLGHQRAGRGGARHGQHAAAGAAAGADGADPPGAVPDAGLRLGPDTCPGRARRRGQPAGCQRRRRSDAGRTADAPRRARGAEPVALAAACDAGARHPARRHPRIDEPGGQQCVDRRGHRLRRQLRHRRAGRLRRGGTARIHPGAHRLRLRHGADGDGRDQHGRGQCEARVARGLARRRHRRRHHRRHRADHGDRPGAVDEPVHAGCGGARIRWVVPAHRRCLLWAVRLRAGLVLCLAGRRTHVLAAGRQRGPAGGRGARRLGLRACAADCRRAASSSWSRSVWASMA